MNLQKKSIVVLLILSFVYISSAHAQNVYVNSPRPQDNSDFLAGIGLFGFAISMVVDIVTAPAAARSYNREFAEISIDYHQYRNRWAYTERHPFGKPEFRKSYLLKKESFFSHALTKNLSQMKRKSGTAAFFLSLGATVVPLAIGATIIDHSDPNGGAGANILFGAGFFVGPGVGHFYAHRPVRAVVGTLLRVGFATLFLTNFEYVDD